MKISQWLLTIVSAGIVGGSGLLILTNPTLSDYETYALEELSLYLEGEGCRQLPSELSLFRGYCPAVIHRFFSRHQDELKQMINQQTTYHNYLLFTLYSTTLELPTPLLTYQVETLGIFKQFYIYRVEKP